MTAAEVIAALGLAPHPEGGWYAETWRAAAAPGARPPGTAILYLLERGQRSHWHRVDADEIWHFHAGAPLVLSLAPADDAAPEDRRLGAALGRGEHPQILVPSGWWQSAAPAPEAGEGWTLVGCTVSPGFSFEGFEMAPPGWRPGRS